jgi:hypothetical protein
MEEGDKSPGRMTIFTTNEQSKDSPGRGCRSFIHGSFIRVRRSGFGTNAADSEKGARSAAHPGLANLRALSGLGTSGWRGALSAEGVKSSVQLPPKDAPLAPVGPFLSIVTWLVSSGPGLRSCWLITGTFGNETTHT